MPERNIEVAGQPMVARADGSLFWPGLSTLFVADVHFGKAASFRAASVPLPVGTTTANLERLSLALQKTGARRLIFLGDLWHDRRGRRSEIIDSLCTWREQFGAVEILLVEGNHDRRAGALPTELRIETVREPYAESGFAYCHYPNNQEGVYCLSGHIHPAVTLKGKAHQSLRLPCFWFGQRCAVLPAFGEFTGRAEIFPQRGDQVLALAGERLHVVAIAEHEFA